MIRLTDEMDEVNRVLKHPDIWPDIAPDFEHPFDTVYLPNVLYFMVCDGDGVIMFHAYREGLKIHPNILPSKRGRLAYIAVEETIRQMFDEGFNSIYAEIDPKLRNVVMFARQLKFRLLEKGDRHLFIRRRLDS